jgi:hypothetical protein
MHGLNQIVRMNREQEEFIAHILSTPTPEVNLLQVWHDWKKEQSKICSTSTDSQSQSKLVNSMEHGAR